MTTTKWVVEQTIKTYCYVEAIDEEDAIQRATDSFMWHIDSEDILATPNDQP